MRGTPSFLWTVPHSTHDCAKEALKARRQWRLVHRCPALFVSCLYSEAIAQLFFLTAESLILADHMFQRVQFGEKGKFSRIMARSAAGLERACKGLAISEELEDLYCSSIVLGSCACITSRPP